MPLVSQKTIDLSLAEFQLLLQEHNLTIATDSPLAPLLAIKPEGNLSQLTEKGIFEKDGEWHDALIAVCDPDFITSSLLAFTGTALSSTHFTNRANSKLIVGCWPIAEKKIRISFPWEPEDIISNSLMALVVDDSTSLVTLDEIHFSPDGFAAFTAAIDTIRTALLASTLQRQQITSFVFLRDQLDEMLTLSRNDKSVDARWLLTLFSTLLPDAMHISKTKITDKGFNELIDKKLITIEVDDRWRPSLDLKKIASDWLIPLPSAYQESITKNIDGSKSTIKNMVLRGSGPLCLIALNYINKKPTISLSSISKDDFWLHLMGQMTPPKSEVLPETKKPKDKQKVSPTDGVLQEFTYKCPSCGAIVKKGQKYCTSCGYKLPENLEPVIKDVSEVKRCPNCGAVLKPGAKFCTECGTKV